MTLHIGSRVRFANPIAGSFSFERTSEGTIRNTVDGGFSVIWDDDPLRDELEYNTGELLPVDGEDEL